MFNINIANDWIRTADLWNWKRPHYQLSHNHFLKILFFLFSVSRARASFRESFRLKGGRKRGAGGAGSVDRNGSGRVRRRPGPACPVMESGDSKPETIMEEAEEKDLEKYEPLTSKSRPLIHLLMDNWNLEQILKELTWADTKCDTFCTKNLVLVHFRST